jgi:glycosyltransferase involved in cell wall biosynthesis
MNHISVCVCTYKRAKHLRKLVERLQNQETDGLFTYSVVVADNDYTGSAEQTIEELRRHSSIFISYCIEPEQNIALARNKAVANAQGEFIAFIDDDEVPSESWLLNLYKACDKFHADGVLGPVIPSYEGKPPKWVVHGKFYERPSHRTGAVLPWTSTRTGNVLLRRDIFDCTDNMFRPEFGSGGEDRDFFRRMINQGFRFVWSAEAPVFEAVPPERYKRSFMLRRALLRGGGIPYNRGLIPHLKSLIAIPLYTLLLPLLFFTQHHLFMKYLIKDLDHIGRLLASFGFHVIKDKYIMK